MYLAKPTGQNRYIFFDSELNQGSGIARPMPASELPGWIENYRAPSVWTQAQT
jgi:hypothetical protein